MEPLIKLQGVTKVFLTDEVETHALAGIDMVVERGEYVSIAGPSGCGKSTLLNIVGMLDSPSSGRFEFLGEDVTHYAERQLSEIRKRNIGFIFQSFNLIEELTVEENIEVALLYHDVPRVTRRERVAGVMEKMGISHRARHRPVQLSGGQQQRVAIARAVVGEQKLILADEPTGNLDSAHVRQPHCH